VSTAPSGVEHQLDATSPNTRPWRASRGEETGTAPSVLGFASATSPSVDALLGEETLALELALQRLHLVHPADVALLT
jgi:hypothetical protein